MAVLMTNSVYLSKTGWLQKDHKFVKQTTASSRRLIYFLCSLHLFVSAEVGALEGKGDSELKKTNKQRSKRSGISGKPGRRERNVTGYSRPELPDGKCWHTGTFMSRMYIYLKGNFTEGNGTNTREKWHLRKSPIFGALIVIWTEFTPLFHSIVQKYP